MVLNIANLHAYYGLSHVLQGISLETSESQVVCLLGRNGAGKSTTLRSIMGITPPNKKGSIQYGKSEISTLTPESISRMGIAYVPEERRIFPELTVFENLKIAQYYSQRKENEWTFEKIIDLFPVIGNRKSNLGSQLSGGEQQMLAIARALIANPDLILMDEPSEGLAPLLVQQVVDTIHQIKKDRITVLLVEQNYAMTEELGDMFYIMNKGQIVFHGTKEEIAREEGTRKRYLSV